MAAPRPDVLRPAALGLAGGCVLGAIYLVVKAQHLATADCPPGVIGEECLIEQSAGAELSRMFLLFALGLALVGAGLFIAVRVRKESSP